MSTTLTVRPSPNIQNLVPGLPERGKIKIGMKGPERTSAQGNKFQPPMKLDHFIVTTMVRGPDGNLLRDPEAHRVYGEKPTRLNVRLLFDDLELNFQSRRAAYKGKTLWCSGDGVNAWRLKDGSNERECRVCPCPLADPAYDGRDPRQGPKCKINGKLAVILDGVGGVGGVYRFRTTSYNSTVGLLSTLAFLKRITGGALAGIPLDLTITPKAVTDPINGAAQTVYVVSLEYQGTMPELQKEGLTIAKSNIEHRIEIVQLENQVRKLLAPPPDRVFETDDEEDVESASGTGEEPEAPAAATAGSTLDRFEQAHAATPVALTPPTSPTPPAATADTAPKRRGRPPKLPPAATVAPAADPSLAASAASAPQTAAPAAAAPVANASPQQPASPTTGAAEPSAPKDWLA